MSKALIKFVRLSPTKAKLIAGEVQGMNAELVMASLKFMPNEGAKYIVNAISSAAADGSFKINEVAVKSRRADADVVLKGFRPCARGGVGRIRKFVSYTTAEVAKPEVKKGERKTPTKAAKKTANTKKAIAKRES